MTIDQAGCTEALTSCRTLPDALERLLDRFAGTEEAEAPMIWHEIVETKCSELCGNVNVNRESTSDRQGVIVNF